MRTDSTPVRAAITDPAPRRREYVPARLTRGGCGYRPTQRLPETAGCGLLGGRWRPTCASPNVAPAGRAEAVDRTAFAVAPRTRARRGRKSSGLDPASLWTAMRHITA